MLHTMTIKIIEITEIKKSFQLISTSKLFYGENSSVFNPPVLSFTITWIPRKCVSQPLAFVTFGGGGEINAIMYWITIIGHFY
jgi:hypothetical protein